MRIWFFDFDGTLSPIVPDREAAELNPVCARMLSELSQSPSDRVAILSSRAFEDIVPRVPLANVIIGGNSGMEWQFPGGDRISLGAEKADVLHARRLELMPLIKNIGRLPGIEVEDKVWSVAIHVVKSNKTAMKKAANSIAAWALLENIPVHQGPDVFEIQLLPGFNKSVGVAFLAGKLDFNEQNDTIIYAGDDENDAVAMQWALQAGGTAIMVGSQLDVPGALYVNDQSALVEMINELRGGGIH